MGSETKFRIMVVAGIAPDSAVGRHRCFRLVSSATSVGGLVRSPAQLSWAV